MTEFPFRAAAADVIAGRLGNRPQIEPRHLCDGVGLQQRMAAVVEAGTHSTCAPPPGAQRTTSAYTSTHGPVDCSRLAGLPEMHWHAQVHPALTYEPPAQPAPHSRYKGEPPVVSYIPMGQLKKGGPAGTGGDGGTTGGGGMKSYDTSTSSRSTRLSTVSSLLPRTTSKTTASDHRRTDPCHQLAWTSPVPDQDQSVFPPASLRRSVSVPETLYQNVMELMTPRPGANLSSSTSPSDPEPTLNAESQREPLWARQAEEKKALKHLGRNQL